MTIKLQRGDSLMGRSSDFYIECASDAFQGLRGIEQVGVSPDVDSTSEDVGIANWIAALTAQKITVVSASTDDDVEGTGARTVRITGLTTGYLEQTEDVDLDGTTPVDTVKNWIRVNAAELVNAGSGGTNAGVVTLTAKSDVTVQGTMLAGTGAVQLAVFTVPANQEGFITDYYSSLIKSSGGAARGIISLFVRKASDQANPAWVMRHSMASVITGSSMVRHDFKPYLLVPEKSDVRLHFTTDDDNTHVVAGFNMIVA